MNKTRHSFSIRVGEKESKMIDELKKPPYYINMSELLRGKIIEFYYEIKNGKINKK